MKRSRDGDEEAQKKNEETKTVFIVHVLEDDYYTYRADLTQEEIALVASKFARSAPMDREQEVSQNGPAAQALRKIMKYKTDDEDGIFYESSGWVSVSSDVVAETLAYTIPWFGYQ